MRFIENASRTRWINLDHVAVAKKNPNEDIELRGADSEILGTVTPYEFKHFVGTIIPAAPGWFTIDTDGDDPPSSWTQPIIAWHIHNGCAEPISTEPVHTHAVLGPDGRVFSPDALYENVDAFVQDHLRKSPPK